MKVVIVTENKVGDGHYKAAKALEQAFQTWCGQEVETKMIGGLRAIHPVLEWFVVHIYLSTIKLFPAVWGLTYKQSRHVPLIQKVGFALKLISWLEKERPDLILCTHPACVPAFSYLKKHSKHAFDLGVVFTDFGFHPFAVSQYVDYYFVAHEGQKQQLMNQYAIDAGTIYNFGIPLGREYRASPKEAYIETRKCVMEDKRSAQRKRQVLLMGGGHGLGPIEHILHVFSVHSSYDLTVICGKNEKLYRRLLQQDFKHVRVLGYVQNMKKWIERADVVISKPGGLTIAETLACGKPLILIEPIPGQEEWNCQFVQNHRLGLYVEHLTDLPDVLSAMAVRPERWIDNRQRLKVQKRFRTSAENIVRTIMSYSKCN